jgi:tRNA nucleotidyltransferase/poly(A) polymerase
MLFEFYEVGGKVRDELLGLESKDIDYVAVPHEVLIKQNISVEEMFDVLIKYLENENFKIFLITKNCFTVRAKFPEKHEYSGVADFVMSRKEISYIENTRTPIVEVGILYDDLDNIIGIISNKGTVLLFSKEELKLVDTFLRNVKNIK